MKKLMTKHFSKWTLKQKIPEKELSNALTELQAGIFEANLGGYIYKREFGLKDRGKAAAEERLFATKRRIEPFSFMDLQKMKNRISPKKNLMLSRNYPKFCSGFQKQKSK